MHRDSLVTIGEALRQEFDNLLGSDWSAYRDFVQDSQRLSSTLTGDIEELVAWMTATGLNVTPLAEDAQSAGDEETVQVRRESARTLAFDAPAPANTAPLAALEPDQRAVAHPAFPTDSTSEPAHERNVPHEPPQRAVPPPTASLSPAQSRPPARPSGQPVPSAPAAPPSANTPELSRGERDNNVPETSVMPPAAEFATVKNLQDLARRIASTERGAATLIPPEATPTEGSRRPAAGSVPEAGRRLPATLRDAAAASQTPEDLQRGSGDERLRVAIGEELAWLLAVQQAEAAARKPETSAQPPQRQIPAASFQTGVTEQGGEEFPITSSPPDEQAASASQASRDDAPEPDVEALLAALARSLNAEYKRYYGA